MMFKKKNDIGASSFNSRSEAFDYMFSYLITNGEDMEDAATRANKFADIICKNKGIPDVVEPKKEGIDKYIMYVNKIVQIKKDNPEVWDLVSGAIGGIIGSFVGSKAAAAENVEVKKEDIDFDNLQ